MSGFRRQGRGGHRGGVGDRPGAGRCRSPQRGARVAASDVDAHGLAETARLIGGGHRTDPLDVTDRAAVLAYAEEVAGAFGQINQVYNNAGVAFAGDVLRSSFEDIERVVDIDFWGVVNGTKAFLPHLIASGDGHVVNISSLFGLLSVPGQSAYNAAKFAVRGFTESLRQEMLLAGHPVRVTCVHPGGIKTNIARNATRSAQYADGKALERFERVALRMAPADAARVILTGVAAQPRAGARGRRRQSARPAGPPDGVGLPAGHGASGAADVQLSVSATIRRSCGLRRYSAAQTTTPR